MKHSETALIKRILAGEKQLFAELIDAYQKPVYNLAYRSTGSREDALDLAQETFLRAFKGLASFDPARPFAPWLFRIATNLCIDHAKKRRVHTVPLTIEDAEGNELERAVADPGEEPAERVVAIEQERELMQAIQQLPEKFRTPLILRHIHHYTYEEIGEVMEIPPGTVKTWIYRGRSQLKDFFKQNFQYEEGEGR